MKVHGIPSQALTREALSDIQNELIKRGIACNWNSAGVLIVDSDSPDTTIQAVMTAEKGINWVVRCAIERAMARTPSAS